MNKIAAFSLVILLIPLQLLAQSQFTYDGPYPIKVVATTGMIAEAVAKIGKQNVAITTLIQSGGDPHLYKPTPQDVMSCTKADAIFYNGLMLEGKLNDILGKYRKKKLVVAVAESIPEKYLLRTGDLVTTLDPHIWMDVRLWVKVTEVIAQALSEFDKQHAEEYLRNSQQYQAQLLALDQYVKSVAQTIPVESRVLITAHDAFNYFGRAYDFEVRGIQGISTDSEAGLKDIANLVELAVTRSVPAIFFETSVPERNIQAVLEGAKAKGASIAVGGSLFSDSMGNAGTREGSYLGMIEHNINTIARGLGGNHPPQGFVTLEDIRKATKE